MKRTTLATAIALVVMGMGFGAALAPNVAADHTNCQSHDWEIQETLFPTERTLDADDWEVGLATLDPGQDMNLRVELTEANGAGVLELEVFEIDGQSQCVSYAQTESACKAQLDEDSENEPITCPLAAEQGQEKEYFVDVVETSETTGIKYEASLQQL